MIKAVLFDFDGVLTIEKTGSAAIAKYIAKRCGLPAEQVRSCYRRYNQALLLGETTHAEIWPAFCEALGQSLDYQLLTDSFRAGHRAGCGYALPAQTAPDRIPDRPGD